MYYLLIYYLYFFKKIQIILIITLMITKVLTTLNLNNTHIIYLFLFNLKTT